MRARKTAAVAGTVALLIAAGACATADGDPAPAATAPSSTDPGTPAGESPSPEPPAETSEPGESPGEDGTAPPDAPAGGPAFLDPGTVAESAPGGAQLLTVTNVRVAANEGFDRVVFDLDGDGSPGWRVEYVDEALDDGSGIPIPVEGGAVLQVRVAGTGMPMDTGVEEYSGDPVNLSGAAVQQVVYRFVFEGYSTAFVGVDEQRPFRVFVLQDPLRVVVDVQH